MQHYEAFVKRKFEKDANNLRKSIDNAEKMVYNISAKRVIELAEALDIYKKLLNEYNTLCIISRGEKFDKFRMAEFSGKVNFAAELRLITGDEWETLFNKIIKAYSGA